MAILLFKLLSINPVYLYSVGADGKVVCEKRDTPSK